jgi:hypothetical protein
MEHARRRCGRSCLGPGFESPRLHEKVVLRDSAPFERAAPFRFPIGVALAFFVRKGAPRTYDFHTGSAEKMPAQAARIYVTDLLSRLRLCPQPISERTLHDWCLERQRALGKPARRGRPRTRK